MMPITVCDVGARGGLDPRWRRIASRLHVVTVDADPQAHVPRPACREHTVIPSALWSESGSLTLNIGQNPGTSSVYAPNMEFLSRFPNPHRYETVRRVTVEAKRLDECGVRPHFLKLDTQGSELEILKGAAGILDTVLGIEVEVEFHPLYKDAPLAGEVDGFLRGHGFELWDMNNYYWRDRVDGRMRQIFADALYFKRPALVFDTERFDALASCYRITPRQGLAHAFQWLTRIVQRGYPFDCDMQIGH